MRGLWYDGRWERQVFEMTQEKIARINALAKKSREGGLTDEERAEQAALRQEYVQAMKASLKAKLDSAETIDEYGVRRPLKKKP